MAKELLMRLADFERRCLEMVVGELEQSGEISDTARRFLRLFVSVTDCYGQIYVLKDIASRMKGPVKV